VYYQKMKFVSFRTVLYIRI